MNKPLFDRNGFEKALPPEATHSGMGASGWSGAVVARSEAASQSNTLPFSVVRLGTFNIVAILLSLVLAVLVSSPALAQDPTPIAVTDDEVNAVARQLYCPVCENIPLDVCPTTACAQWRDLIRQKLSEGDSAEQIKEYFADQYGERVLAMPRATGFNWLLVPVPIAAFAVGVYILYRALKSLRKPAGEAAAPAQQAPVAPPPDEYVKRLEEELRKR